MHVSAQTAIAAPRQVVWDYIMDPKRHLDFMDGMTRWRIEGAKRSRLGARFSMGMRIGSVELGGLIEVVEFDPPCDMAWTSITGIDHRGRWRLRAANGRGTRVQLRVTYHAVGILAHLADLIAAPIVKRHLQRSLDTLKQQVEPLARPHAAARRSKRASTGE